MTPRQRARGLLADAIAAQGTAWSNAASLVREGFENLWIKPAIDAMEALVLLCGDALEEDDSEEGRA